MRPIRITQQLAAADPNAIAEDQTTVGAGDLVLDGALVVNGVAVMDTPRQVAIESAGNLSAITFTVFGTNSSGNVVSESLAGPNAGTVVTGRDDWVTITQISVSAAVGTNVEVGTNGVGGSIPIPLDQYISPFNVSLGVIIGSGTADVTIQYTFDDVWTGIGEHTWLPHPDLTNVTANADGTFISPVTACRILTNSGTDPVLFEVIQAGLV